jgi:hypothetical protein
MSVLAVNTGTNGGAGLFCALVVGLIVLAILQHIRTK